MQNGNGKKKALKGSLFKKSLLAASTVFVFGAVTAAAQSNNNFTMFFGEEAAGVVENKPTIQEAKIVSGIEMEVEESIIGGKSAIILVSFEKEDGTAFLGDIKIPTPELDWKQNASYMVDQQMTEDRKKLIAMFDIDTTSSIDGKKITIMADKLVDSKTNKVVANGPFQISFVASEHPTSQNIEINQKLTELNEELALHNMNISANGIGIEGKRIDGKTDVLPNYKPVIKVTTMDNKIFELKSSSTSTTKSGFKWQYNLNAAEERTFLNDENIKSVIVDGHVTDVHNK